MKRKIFGLMIVLLLCGSNLYAADGDLIVNGKLGISTTNPPAALSVGSGNPFQVNTAGLLNITSSSAGPLIYIKELGSGYGSANAAIVSDTDNPNGSSNYSFQGRVQGSNTFSVRSDGQGYFAGNLGIGTTAPAQKLDVAGYIKGQSGLCIGSDCRTSWPSGLTGSGTTNYLARWTGTSSLGNSVIYDNGAYVGIGTTTPPYKLSINLLPNEHVYINQSAASYQAQIIFADRGTPKWQVGKQTDNNFFIFDTTTGKYALWSGAGNVALGANGGNVGIGVLNPSYQFQLSSDSAAKPATSTWTIGSDARLKTNIQPYTKGLKEILQINPVSYKYNGKGGIGHNKVSSKDPITGEDIETEIIDTDLLAKTNVGVLAQDIQTVVPETVSSHKGKLNKDDTDETDILDFNPHALTFILINAVKDLSAQIDSLNQQIADLKGKVK